MTRLDSGLLNTLIENSSAGNSNDYVFSSACFHRSRLTRLNLPEDAASGHN